MNDKEEQKVKTQYTGVYTSKSWMLVTSSTSASDDQWHSKLSRYHS